MRGLVEAVKRCQNRLQGWSFELQRFGNGQLLLLGMGVPYGPAQALSFQPPVELLDAGKAQAGLEEAASDGLHLVFNLPLLPPRRWRAGRGLDHVMISHDQKAAVEHPLLADEHGGDRGLHVIVDPAQRNATKEGEAAGMGVKHHLLCLAWIGSDIDCPRRA